MQAASMLRSYRPLLPVIVGTLRGWLRISKIIGRWTQGMIKCVPSPTVTVCTPLNRSKMTARWPPSTAYSNTSRWRLDTL